MLCTSAKKDHSQKSQSISLGSQALATCCIQTASLAFPLAEGFAAGCRDAVRLQAHTAPATSTEPRQRRRSQEAPRTRHLRQATSRSPRAPSNIRRSLLRACDSHLWGFIPPGSAPLHPCPADGASGRPLRCASPRRGVREPRHERVGGRTLSQPAESTGGSSSIRAFKWCGRCSRACLALLVLLWSASGTANVDFRCTIL